MKYRVHVPLGKPLVFPTICPFTDSPSPSSRIKLKQTSTSAVLPLPGGFLNAYSSATVEIPASRKIAVLAQILQLSIWLSIIGGIAVCVWLINFDNSKSSKYEPISLIGGLVFAFGFRLLRFFILRKVRLKGVWNGFAEVHFQSEAYARDFSKLNRLAVVND